MTFDWLVLSEGFKVPGLKGSTRGSIRGFRGLGFKVSLRGLGFRGSLRGLG